MKEGGKEGRMKQVFTHLLKELFACPIDSFQNPRGELQIQQKLFSTPSPTPQNRRVCSFSGTYTMESKAHLMYAEFNIRMREGFFPAMLSE